MGESKPDTPYRIRVDANIKYAVSAYPDSWGRGLKRSRNLTPLQERMQKLWARPCIPYLRWTEFTLIKKSRLSLIVRVNVVLNRTVVVNSD